MLLFDDKQEYINYRVQIVIFNLGPSRQRAILLEVIQPGSLEKATLLEKDLDHHKKLLYNMKHP